jgi:anti-sigma B factor antagonist
LEVVMAFTHHVHADSAGLVVAVSGEMDLTVAGAFEDTVQRLIAGRRPGLVRIDLGGLEFLDSTGVSVLVRLWRMARRENCSLRVINPTGVVRQILDVTGAMAIVGGPMAPESVQ